MDLRITDVATLLNLGEEQINAMVESGEIPSYEMNGQLRFSRAEIEAWVMKRERDEGRLIGAQKGIHQFNLYRAIHRGGVLVDVPGNSKEEVIKAAASDLAERFGFDGAVLFDLLLDRERLMPTALGKGVAVPHARDFLLSTSFDIVTVVFPKKPLDYGALDGQPVDTLFFLFACQDGRHLNLLAKIAYLAADENARLYLRSKPNQVTLLNFIRDWETKLGRTETLK